MRERGWRKWEIIGLLVTIAAGNALHFVYDWSGGSAAAALFSAVNESVWEHMKLLAVPWILWTVVQALALRGSGLPILTARTAGLLAGMVTIPLLYYTYSGVLGRSISLVNIIIFQIAVLLAFAVSWRLHRERPLAASLLQIASAVVLVAVVALLVWWTFDPPLLPVFIDPSTGTAGRTE